MSGVPAARVGDPIAHSNAGQDMVIGALIGLVAGAVLVGAVVASGGAALAVVAAAGGAAGLTSFGGLKGMFIGEASMGSPTGALVVGSTNVRINGRFATMTEIGQAICSDHSGQIPLATGAATVFINGLPAGRLGEKLGCSALVIAPCSPNVNIGGPSVADPNVVITLEVPAWAVTGLQVLGVAGAVMALPYAIATVGVAATIGGGVAGYFGGEYGGKGGRALGTAMGMSETGIRSMEAGASSSAGWWAARRERRAGSPPMPAFWREPVLRWWHPVALLLRISTLNRIGPKAGSTVTWMVSILPDQYGPSQFLKEPSSASGRRPAGLSAIILRRPARRRVVSASLPTPRSPELA